MSTKTLSQLTAATALAIEDELFIEAEAGPRRATVEQVFAAPRPPVELTEDTTIDAAANGTTYVNTSDEHGVTVTLPAATAGLWFRFIVHEAFAFNVGQGEGDAIRLGATEGGLIFASQPGYSTTLECAVDGYWTQVAGEGWAFD